MVGCSVRLSAEDEGAGLGVPRLPALAVTPPTCFLGSAKGDRELAGTSPGLRPSLPGGWPARGALSASRPSAQATSTSAWLTAAGSWRWR